MILNNKTNIPNSILSKALLSSAFMVEADPKKIVVEVVDKRCKYIRGMAWEPKTNGKYDIKLWFPVKWYGNQRQRGKRRDEDHPLVWAETIYRVMVHEWKHIADHQTGNDYDFSKRGPGGRRPRHDDRPEEMRAYSSELPALKRLKASQEGRDILNSLADYAAGKPRS